MLLGQAHSDEFEHCVIVLACAPHQESTTAICPSCREIVEESPHGLDVHGGTPVENINWEAVDHAWAQHMGAIDGRPENDV